MRVLGLLRVFAALAAAVVLAGQLGPVSAAHADPTYPNATITSPAPGPVSGVVPVTAEGHADPAMGDIAWTLSLLVDGAPTETVDCYVTPQPDCAGTFHWDSSAADPGPHTLVVELMTFLFVVDSAPVTVTVTPPAPPAVAINSPASGDVSGPVSIDATGTVDPRSADAPKSLQLLVDGTVTGQPLGCPATPDTCTGDLPWDSTGLNGTRTVQVRFTTEATSVDSAPVQLNAVNPGPTSVIVSPAAGATVAGVVAVLAQGSVSPHQADAPASVQLLIDGVAVGAAPSPCTGTAASPRSCSVPYTWDATGLTGPHTLQARFVTRRGAVVLSPVSTVTVVSPAPTVRITAPGPGAVVHRTASITVAGAVDPTQTDTPSSVTVTVDGAALGAPTACSPDAANPRACNVAVLWTTLGLTGKHTIVATLTTARGAVATSTPTAVYVYGGTKVAFVAQKTRHAGPVKVTGRVTAIINKSAVGGVKVKILIRPARGRSRTLSVLTNAKGYFVVPYKLAMNTTLEATVIPPAYYGTSHTFTKLTVVPTLSCKVGPRAKVNRLDSGSCRLATLPKGTKVSLQYGFHGHWYTIGSGRTPAKVVPFSFRFAKPGTYSVRLVLSATSVFVKTTGPSLKVVVT